MTVKTDQKKLEVELWLKTNKSLRQRMANTVKYETQGEIGKKSTG